MRNIKIEIPQNLSFIKQHFSTDYKYLVKLGGFKDGGYVADYFSLIQSRILISGGVGSNVRFESDFYDINQSLNIVLVDPTVSVFRMFVRGFYHFTKKGQSGFRSLSEVLNYLFLVRQSKLIKKYLGSSYSIHNVLSIENIQFNGKSNGKSVFIKLDIEGAEYDLLQGIINLKEQLTGVCIEFHDLNHLDNREKLASFLTELNFSIVHISVNEVCLTEGDYPSVLEISLAPAEQKEQFITVADLDEMYLQASNTLDHELVYLKR
jgi:hypothetical protein